MRARSYRRCLRLAIVAAICSASFCRFAAAANTGVMTVPYHIHVPLLFKLTSKSRTLPARLGGQVVVAVAGRKSLVAVREITSGKLLLGRPIKVVEFDRKGAAADIIYIGPDTPTLVERICEEAQKVGAITMTGVPEFVLRGVAIGVKLSPSRRPKIMVNLEAAKEAGVDFPSGILSIAEVVGR